MTKERTLGIVRHILTFGGGYLAAKGIGDEAMWAEVAGTIITIIGTIWSVKAPEKAKA